MIVITALLSSTSAIAVNQEADNEVESLLAQTKTEAMETESVGRNIKQQGVGSKCNGPIARLIREKKGNIAAGSLFTDRSFPANKYSIGLNNSQTNSTWVRPI